MRWWWRWLMMMMMMMMTPPQRACWPGPLQQLSRDIGERRTTRLGRRERSRPTERYCAHSQFTPKMNQPGSICDKPVPSRSSWWEQHQGGRDRDLAVPQICQWWCLVMMVTMFCLVMIVPIFLGGMVISIWIVLTFLGWRRLNESSSRCPWCFQGSPSVAEINAVSNIIPQHGQDQWSFLNVTETNVSSSQFLPQPCSRLGPRCIVWLLPTRSPSSTPSRRPTSTV